jgi:hypothetical protein
LPDAKLFTGAIFNYSNQRFCKRSGNDVVE